MATKNGESTSLSVPVDINSNDFRSLSIRGLLGSFRHNNGDIDSAEAQNPYIDFAEAQNPYIDSTEARNPDINSAEARNPYIDSPEAQNPSPSAINYAGSPLTEGSLYRQDSSMRSKLLTPSRTFARIMEEKEEKSRMTPTPEDMVVKDGIKLSLLGKVKWEDLKRDIVTWLSKPMNVVLLLWLIAVAVSGAILFMVMVGMLNKALPTKRERDRWFEITNQILNALFTAMALYQHPKRILHLHYLIRYNPQDIVKLREEYCKDGLRKPHEWAHILVVVLLLQLNCFAQYALAGLNWGYKRANRPAIGVGITLFLSFGAAATAGMYNTLSPLGRDYFPDSGDGGKPEVDDSMEKGHSSSNHPSLFRLRNPKYKRLVKKNSSASRQGIAVENPQWHGGVFGCWEEPQISILTTLCFPCVMGFNYERLGFGNRYVHIATFLLLVASPFLIFNLAAINLNGVLRTSLGVSGAALCIFSLLYGGFWRIKIRERYKLPAHSWCCKQPRISDCFQWLLCPFCSLCQEVRTAEAYDVRNDRFFVRPIHIHPSEGSSLEHVPPSPFDMHPLQGSPMVHLEDTDLEQDRPVDWETLLNQSILNPPPAQSMYPLSDY